MPIVLEWDVQQGNTDIIYFLIYTTTLFVCVFHACVHACVCVCLCVHASVCICVRVVMEISVGAHLQLYNLSQEASSGQNTGNPFDVRNLFCLPRPLGCKLCLKVLCWDLIVTHP